MRRRQHMVVKIDFVLRILAASVALERIREAVVAHMHREHDLVKKRYLAVIAIEELFAVFH